MFLVFFWVKYKKYPWSENDYGIKQSSVLLQKIENFIFIGKY